MNTQRVGIVVKKDLSWTHDLRVTHVAVFCLFTNLFLLAPVIPFVVVQDGGQASQAGIAAALFSAITVVCELQSPRLLRHHSHRRLLIFALGVTCASSFAYIGVHSQFLLTLVLQTMRGGCFGLGVAVSIALVAAVTPSDKHGASIGYYGLMSAIPSIVCPSLGLYLLLNVGRDAVFFLACTCAFAGLVAAILLQRGRVSPNAVAMGFKDLMQLRGLLVPVIAAVLVCFSYGAILSFGPFILPATGIASATSFFLVFGIFRSLSRWLSGGLTDRHGTTLQLLGMASALAAVAFLALAHSSDLVLGAAIVFGAAFGLLLNTLYVHMLQQVFRAQYTTVSALYSAAVDGGVSIGALSLGVMASRWGYATAFWSLPVVLTVALALVVLRTPN